MSNTSNFDTLEQWIAVVPPHLRIVQYVQRDVYDAVVAAFIVPYRCEKFAVIAVQDIPCIKA